MMEVGAKLRLKRTQRGLTQNQLAEQMYVSVKTIANWERGRTIPDIESMLRLAKVYGISLDDLLTEDSDWVTAMKAKEKEQATRKSEYLQGPVAMQLIIMLMWVLPLLDKQTVFPPFMTLLLFGATLSNTVSLTRIQQEIESNQWLKREQRLFQLLVILIVVVALVHWYLNR